MGAMYLYLIHSKKSKILSMKLVFNFFLLYYEIQEIARDISDFRENTYFDEDERKEVEMRFDVIYSLKRKYGNSIVEILKYGDEINLEIHRRLKDVTFLDIKRVIAQVGIEASFQLKGKYRWNTPY